MNSLHNLHKSSEIQRVLPVWRLRMETSLTDKIMAPASAEAVEVAVVPIGEEKETDYRDATEEEQSAYHPGVDKIPKAVWIVAIIGAAERFSFYAITVPWRM